MPELPEVEITARRLDAALRGATIESALTPGINALKTFDPPLHAIEGATIEGVRRRGKHVVVDISGGLALLVHLMSAGRLQVYDKRASLRDRTSRLLVRIAPGNGEDAGRELRLREFGTKQAAWVKVLRAERIPLTARIVSAADSFDAMTSDRAYRTALPRREACRRLRSGAGRQFDPRVIDALLRVVGCGPLRRS